MALIILSRFTVVAAGLDVFHTNCTIPESKVSFSTAPNTRGTLEIVWTSVATIIACVYTVLHLNLPEQRQGRDPGWKGDLYWSLKGMCKSLKYSLLMIFIPELLLGKSIRDLRVAQRSLEELHRSVPETRTTWTLQHMLYAGMGGFVAVDRSDEPSTTPAITADANCSMSIRHHSESALQSKLSSSSEQRISASLSPESNTASDKTLSTSHIVESHTAMSTPGELKSNTEQEKAMSTPGDLESNTRASHRGSQHSTNRPSLYHLRCETLVLALKKNLISKEPPLSEAEIMDKSKSDVVSKTVAIFQICYFVVGVIARAAQHLTVSPLELGACAFVPYAIAIYWFSHKKVKAPRAVTVLPGLSVHAAASVNGEAHDADSLVIWTLTPLDGTHIPNHRYEVVLDHAGNCSNLLWDTGLIPIALSIPFGAIHIAAWDYDFPTQIDAYLWRTASIMITVMLSITVLTPLVFWILDRVLDKLGLPEMDSWAEQIGKTLFLLAVSLYLLARLVIVVEMFRTLAYLQPGSYITTWTTNVPHIG